jgi:hypothetical protein
MPSHTRGKQEPLAYYTRVLLALARREGGELRIKCSDIDSLNERAILYTDYDGVSGELVIRAGTQFAEMVVVSPESAEWVRPERQQEQTAKPARVAIPTDSDLAEIEAGLLRRAAQRRQSTSGSTPARQTS